MKIHLWHGFLLQLDEVHVSKAPETVDLSTVVQRELISLSFWQVVEDCDFGLYQPTLDPDGHNLKYLVGCIEMTESFLQYFEHFQIDCLQIIMIQFRGCWLTEEIF